MSLNDEAETRIRNEKGNIFNEFKILLQLNWNILDFRWNGSRGEAARSN